MPGPTERDPIEFAAETLDAFERAFALAPDRSTRSIVLAGRTIRIRFAAPALAERFGPALGLLEGDAATSSNDPPDLDICCWDRSTTEVRAPAPPWSLGDQLPAGRIRGLTDGRIRATFDPVSRVLCLHDSERRASVVHVARADHVPVWMDRAPFRTVLTWWAADCGLALLHAASVATDDGAVVMAGTSGAGKSTTAVRCLLAGLDFLGDDACLVTADPGPVVHSLYRFAKLDVPLDEPEFTPLARALPWITDGVVVDPGARHRTHAPLRAILLPQMTGRPESRIVPVPRTEAMRLLGPTTLVEGGAPSPGALRAVVDLVARVPASRLELGTDPAGIVAAVVAATGQ